MGSINSIINHPNFRPDESVIYYFESLKNILVGKVHYPHGHMIDKGIQAVTIEAVLEKSKKKKYEAQDDYDRMSKFIKISF